MQLKLKRTQRSGGMMGGKIIFALDARADLSADEKALVSKYKLGTLSIYDSEARKRHAVAATEHSEATRTTGTLGTFYRLGRASLSAAMMALSLKVTIDSLSGGQHIECKDMDELLGAEAAIVEACRSLKAYLETALSFDGREEMIEF